MGYTNETSIIGKMKDLARTVLPEGGHVWLYGSRARGDERSDSDWDLLILIDKPQVESTDEDNISYPFVYLGWQMNEDVNPMLYTYSEWKERMASPFFQNVERDKLQLA